MSRLGAHGCDLAELASHLITKGPRKVLPTPRRVRVIFRGFTIVDTTKALFVWEHDYYPHYYVPLSEIKHCTFKDLRSIQSNEHGIDDGVKRASVLELTVPAPVTGGKCTTDRVLGFSNDPGLGALASLVRLEFNSMDAWLEEDLPIYVHPKDPFKRIDILPSARPIEVKVGGKTVASGSFAMHLHETGLPTRYYFSLGFVDQSVLSKSDLVTKCPYKGDAEYYHVEVDGKEYQNIVWYYGTTTHECTPIAGMVSFYNEKVDIYLDGKLLEQS